jgi:hypothetical protein
VPCAQHQALQQRDCVSCNINSQLLADPDVSKYVNSQKCLDCKIPVETAMCENFKGWRKFAEHVLGITSNICLQHVTSNVKVFCALCIALIPCVSGIAEANSSHVRKFPNVAAQDDSYDIVIDTFEIGVDQLATRVQSLLVEYLRAHYGDDTANWCERYWTGDCGRY